MKIIKLTSENVLKLNAVEITPEGNLIVIGGENEQGKTSVLDSIVLAMGGRLAKHTKPLKSGRKKGHIICELDDLVVKRTFTKAGGSTLTVSSKNGDQRYTAPQKVLDKLIGSLSFDPLAWVNMDDKKQVTILKEMVGLDFSELDEKRQGLYAERTTVNRNKKELEVQLDAGQYYSDVPKDEVSVSGLMKELDAACEHNNANNRKKDFLIETNENLKYGKLNLQEDQAELERIQKDLEGQQDVIKERKKNIQRLKKACVEQADIVNSLVGMDEEIIRERIDAADSVNQKVRANIKHAETKRKLSLTEKDSERLTDDIEAIDNEKTDTLSKTKFPIKGMAFDEDEVLYKDIPFQQASSAEKLRVSVAMGIAMNPELKVLLIRDGSLLDEKNLKMIAEMAEKADGQVWLERVGKGKECQVIIEDGNVKE